MSLVVAQATDEGPRIVSDTRVVLPHGQLSSFKGGTLKAVVVDREVTICFAGDVERGLESIRGFARGLNSGRSVEDLLTTLRELTSVVSRAVDFIVAKGAEQVGSQLIRIRDGEIERGRHSTWIGEPDAFERFQQERNRPLSPSESELEGSLPPTARVMSTLQRAMRVVIADPRIRSVDDFCIAVGRGPSGFQYYESVFIYVERDIRVEPGDDLISKMAHQVEEGGYTVSVVPPREPGTPAVGLSFPRARLGMLYLPLQFAGAEVMEVSAKDFARLVLKRFGVAMKHPMVL